MITDPYRPTVWATPSDDIPLVVESGHKLPTRSEKLSYMRDRNANEEDPHEDTIHKIPEPADLPWKMFSVIF
jgi:hypothetical protein